jgi:chromosome condensin MukBEF complex kleisin-like MukF subunit
MSFYCGVDLHLNNYLVVVIDGDNNKVVGKRITQKIIKFKECSSVSILMLCLLLYGRCTRLQIRWGL